MKRLSTCILALWFTISTYIAVLTSRAALIRYIILTEWFGQAPHTPGYWYRRGKYFVLEGEPTDRW